MSILEAIQNALAALEAEGYTGGDLHDDLLLVIGRLQAKYPAVAKEVL